MPNTKQKIIDNIIAGLSDEQKKVALHFEGALQVIAGPGSGKTETMSRRAAILIDGYGVDPSNMLLTTFTEKAAENLKNRVKKYVSNKFVVENLTIGTIHSVCMNILEEFGIKSGQFSRSIRVLDENKQSLFIWTNFEDIGLKEFFDKPSSASVNGVLKYYSNMMERGTNLDALSKKVDLEDEKNLTLKAAIKTYDKYVAILDKNQAVDFSSIIRKVRELLEDKNILEEVREKYKFLMIDEYQDTNPLQDEILRMIASPNNNIMVIGDDDQSLYRFRGATVTNFLAFEKNVSGTAKYYLSENRRSTPEIVSASVTMASAIPENGRVDKKLFTQNSKGSPVTLTSYDTDEDEITGLANSILQLKNAKTINSYSDVAILSYSIGSIFPKLKESLDALGIPFKVKGDKSFIGQPIVQALMNGMWLFTKKRGDVKNFDLLSENIFYFSSSKTREEVGAFKTETDLVDVENISELKITSKYDAERLFKLILIRKEILGSSYRKGYTDLVDMFFKLIQACDTLKFLTLENTFESEESLNFIGKFSKFILEYSDETGSRKFSDFKSYVYAILNRNTDSPSEDLDDAVVIQTIHQSKGLEYPVVFMPGLVESRIPGNRQDLESIPFFKGVHKYWEQVNTFENMDTDFIRVLYVGMTRAENLLYLSFFKKMKKLAKPSPYIQGLINNELIHKIEFTVPTDAIVIKPRHKDDKLRISSSHLQYYIFCPTRYKFALKHGVQAPHRGYFAFGSNLHSAIEEASNLVRISGAQSLDDEKIKDLFERHWNDYGFLNKGAASAQKKVAEQRFSTFVNSHKETLSTVLHAEKKFVLEEDNFILTGKIDAITEAVKNKLVVIDFKTGERKKFEQEPESSFVNYQGNIYMEAVERTLGVVPESYHLHFLGEDQSKVDDYKWGFEITQESRKGVISILNDTAEKIKLNDFAPNSNPERCKSCEFKNVCPFSSKKAA